MRHLRISRHLIVPEEGTSFQVVEGVKTEYGPVFGVEIWVPGKAEPFRVVGPEAEALGAFVGNLQSFPTTLMNGRELIDIPAGWQQSQQARGMMGAGETVVAARHTPPSGAEPVQLDWQRIAAPQGMVSQLAFPEPSAATVYAPGGIDIPNEPSPGMPRIRTQEEVERALRGEVYK